MGLARTTFLYFTPTVVTLLISLAMVPITTAYLGAEELGRIALLTAYGHLVVAVATASSSYIWAAHYFGLAEKDKPAFVTTLVIVGVALTALVMSLTAVGWLALRDHVSYFADTSGLEIALVIGMAGALACWSHLYPLLILESQARWIAVVSITGTVVMAGTTTLGLALWELGIRAVLLGSLLGAIVHACGALAGASQHLRLTWSSRWCGELVHVSLLRTPQCLFEPLASMAERWMVTNWVSLAALGLYSHSQSYRSGLASALGALGKSLLPVALLEARQGSREFPQTRKGAHFAIVGLTLAGVGFALFGKEVVGLLTHEKFAGAAPFISFWLIHATLAFTAREDMAILQTANRKGYLTAVSLITQLANLAAMLVLIPIGGLWGAVAALLVEVTLLRVLLRWQAGRIHPTPLADFPLLLGILVSFAALAVQMLFWDNLGARAAMLTALLGCYLIFERAYVVWLYRLVLGKSVALLRRRADSLPHSADAA